MSCPYLIQGKNIIVVIDGAPHMVTPSHIAYQEIWDAVHAGQYDRLPTLCSVKSMMAEYTNGDIAIQDGTLLWKGNPIHSTLTARIIEMRRQHLDFAPMVKFLINLMRNPSKVAIQELYDFLSVGNLPITEDGHFIAYKRVTANFRDCYTKKIDNSVGKTVSMPREAVNSNRNETCSSGLHFCSYQYLSHFGSNGDKTVLVKINPADVVSIPADYNNTKGRCCKYVVVQEVTSRITPNMPNGVFDDSLLVVGSKDATVSVAPKLKQPPTAAPVSTADKPGLSMTPNAIKKRAKRAAEKAAAEKAAADKAAAEKAKQEAATKPPTAKPTSVPDKPGLSMTPNAIKKRAKRAAEKAARDSKRG